jgi:hypothetical protein
MEIKQGGLLMQMILELPDDTFALFSQLVILHPGQTRDQVMARALTSYHALYDMYLQDQLDGFALKMMEHLDELEDKEKEEERE